MEGKDRKELQNEVANDEKLYFRYVIIVFIWEDKYNNPSAPLVRTVEELPFAMLTKVYAVDTVELEASLQLGVLWDPPTYRRHFKKDIPKGQMKTVTVGNKKVRGIILEISFGTPIGTYVLKQKFKSGATKETEIERSDTAVRGTHQTDDAWKGMQGRLKVDVKAGDGSSDVSASVKQAPAPADDDDIMDSIWKPVFDKKSSGSSKRTQSGQCDPTSAASSAASAAAADDELGANIVSPPSKKGKSDKRQQELNTTEQALLKAKHLLQEIQAATALSMPRLQSVMTLLRNRSSDKLVQYYTMDDPDGVSAGCRTIDRRISL